MKRLILISMMALITLTTYSRRAWEPTDVMPMLSTRSVITMEFGEHYFWIGTDNGVLRLPYFDGEADVSSWEAFIFDFKILDLLIKEDSVFVFTTDGVYAIREHAFYDEGFSEVQEFPRFAPNIGACPPRGESYFMPMGYIWLSDGYIRDIHSNDYTITDCAQDNLGNLYLSTDGIGIFKVPYRSGYAEKFVFGPCCDYVSSISKYEDGFIFAGCNDITDCFLTLYDTSDNSFTNIEGLVSPVFNKNYLINDISCIKDRVFLATSQGLELYDLRDNNWIRALGMNSIPMYSANAIAISNNSIYIASNDGVYSADISSRVFKLISPFIAGKIMDIEASDDRVYAVGDGGVWVSAGTSMVRFDTPDGTITNFVRCVSSGPLDEIVFGSRYGILILDSENRRKILSSSIDLNGRIPNDIIATRRFLWIATDCGLYVYNRLTKSPMFLGKDYFLPEISIQSLFLDDDYLWLCTELGLFRFFWNDGDRIYFH